MNGTARILTGRKADSLLFNDLLNSNIGRPTKDAASQQISCGCSTIDELCVPHCGADCSTSGVGVGVVVDFREWASEAVYLASWRRWTKTDACPGSVEFAVRRSCRPFHGSQNVSAVVDHQRRCPEFSHAGLSGVLPNVIKDCAHGCCGVGVAVSINPRVNQSKYVSR